MPSASAQPPVRGRSPWSATAVLALLAGLLLSACGGGGADGSPATACGRLGGALDLSRGTSVCDVPRTAYTTERVVLREDGTVDPADATRRRAACAADDRRARARATTAARAGGARTYATVRWSAPGVCRAARATLPAAVAAQARADRLLDEADRALPVDPRTALEAAERADAAASTARSRRTVDRARRALRPVRLSPSTQLVSPNEYLGMDCAAIGREFRVAPGSDPAHDPDGDGRACERE